MGEETVDLILRYGEIRARMGALLYGQDTQYDELSRQTRGVWERIRHRLEHQISTVVLSRIDQSRITVEEERGGACLLRLEGGGEPPASVYLTRENRDALRCMLKGEENGG